MAVEIFVGEPPAYIKQKLIEEAAENCTKFRMADGSLEIHNIVGELDKQWMKDHGYMNEASEFIRPIAAFEAGAGLTAIGNDTFDYCQTLVEAKLEKGVQTIHNGAFSSCRSLKNVVVGSNVQTIQSEVFTDCTGLESMLFKGRTIQQVQSMSGYSWDIEDTSVISAEL